MKRHNSHISTAIKAMLLGCMVAVLSACGGKNAELTSLIPSEAQMVARIDFKRIIENAGCSINEDGTIVLSNAIANALTENGVPPIAYNSVLKYAEGFDLSSVYFVVSKTSKDSSPVLIARMSDSDKVKENLQNIFGKEPTKLDGYTVFGTGDGEALILDDNVIWFAQSVEAVKGIKNAAKDSDITSLTGIDSFVNGEDAFAIAVNLNGLAQEMSLPSSFNSKWLCGKADVSGQKATGELCVMDTEGNRVSVADNFDPVDTDIANYLPRTSSVAFMAIGKPKGALANLLSSYASQMGDQSFIVDDLDGSIFLGIDSDTLANLMGAMMANGMSLDSLDPVVLMQNIELIVRAQYTPDATAKFINFISDIVMMSGQTPLNLADGIRSVTFDGIQAFYGNVDGYVTISNFPLAPVNNDFSSIIEGHLGIIYSSSQPNDLSAMIGVNFGTEGYLALDNDCLVGNVKVTSTDKKFLEAYVEAFMSPEFIQLISAMEDEYYDDSYYYY